MRRYGVAASVAAFLAGAAMVHELRAADKDVPASPPAAGVTAQASSAGGSAGAGAATGGAVPAAVAPAGGAAASTHYWYDGGRRRPLVLDADQTARFGAKSRAVRPEDVLLPSALATKDTLSAGEAQSPVLRDERGRPRALPGGVIVTLPRPTVEVDARQRLQALGLTPVRPIGSGWQTWLVASEPGMASLALANRLQESGAVSAQPNWWEPRATK